jgi:hypothetical protein
MIEFWVGKWELSRENENRIQNVSWTMSMTSFENKLALTEFTNKFNVLI